MTIQVVMTGTDTFHVAPNTCEYPCIDLQGTWVLSRSNPDICMWCHETTISRVVGSCTDSGYETWTVSFLLYYSLGIIGPRTLILRITAVNCESNFAVQPIAYAEGVPSTTVCADWTVAETLTPDGLYECGADLDSVTVSTP
jgi:hypothetical protein